MPLRRWQDNALIRCVSLIEVCARLHRGKGVRGNEDVRCYGFA